jgi:hypothetical protein
MSDLLNCPFCGESVRCQSTVTDVAVWCIACDVKMVRLHYVGTTVNWNSTPRVVAAWNRRAPVPLPAAATEPTPGQIELLCLSVQDVINGRLETGDAAADLAAVKEHLDTALKLTGLDGEAG